MCWKLARSIESGGSGFTGSSESGLAAMEGLGSAGNSASAFVGRNLLTVDSILLVTADLASPIVVDPSSHLAMDLASPVGVDVASHVVVDLASAVVVDLCLRLMVDLA